MLIAYVHNLCVVANVGNIVIIILQFCLAIIIARVPITLLMIYVVKIAHLSTQMLWGLPKQYISTNELPDVQRVNVLTSIILLYGTAYSVYAYYYYYYRVYVWAACRDILTIFDFIQTIQRWCKTVNYKIDQFTICNNNYCDCVYYIVCP